MSVTRIKNYTEFVNENLNGGFAYGGRMFEAETTTTPKLEMEGNQFVILSNVDTGIDFKKITRGSHSNLVPKKETGLKWGVWSDEDNYLEYFNKIFTIKFDIKANQLGAGSSLTQVGKTNNYKTGVYTFIDYSNIPITVNMSKLNTYIDKLKSLAEDVIKYSCTTPQEWIYTSTSYARPSTLQGKETKEVSVPPKSGQLQSAISGINEYVDNYNELISQVSGLLNEIGISDITTMAINNEKAKLTKFKSLKSVESIKDVQNSMPWATYMKNSFITVGALAMVKYMSKIYSSDTEYLKYLMALSKTKVGKKGAKELGLIVKKQIPTLSNLNLDALNEGLNLPSNFRPLNEAKSCKTKVVKFLEGKDCVVDYTAGTCKVGTKTMKIEKALLKFQAPESLIKSYTEECTKEVNEALRIMRRR